MRLVEQVVDALDFIEHFILSLHHHFDASLHVVRLVELRVGLDVSAQEVDVLWDFARVVRNLFPFAKEPR